VHLFADDLKRFLADLPVRARPQTLRYRTVKFLRRNRGSLFAASLAAVSLIAGTAISLHQARRADRRFQEVRSLANSFLFEIHDEIETLPGSTHARELMVRTVLRYLNNLARESDDDPSLLWELATAYQKIGDVQGYGFRPNLGQRAEALESHRRGLEIAERLAAFGYQPKVQRLLAVAHDRIGMLRSGDQPHSGAGIEHYKRSIETLERLNRSEPGSPENYRLLITTHYHLARAEMLRGQTAEAAALWHRTLALAREWESRNPGEAARLAVGTAHWSVSTARQFLGDLRGALEHARAAIAIHEPLVAAQPSSTARQRELLNSYERLSYVFANPDFLNLGDLAGAREYNRKVVAIASALYEADPRNEMAASDLAIAKRFECAFALDDAPAVVRACQEALNVSARIPRSHAEALPEVAMRLGPALARLGRRAEGVKIMESGIDSLEASLATWPWRVDLRLRLLRTHHWLGGVLLGGGNAGEALRHYQSALEIGQALLPERQQDPALLRDLADCYRSLGRFYEQRDCRQARDWHRKDLETWAEWPRHFPSTGVDQRRREGAARNLGRCAVR
jgi:tetratricopeptide (TPR) repeat protein